MASPDTKVIKIYILFLVKYEHLVGGISSAVMSTLIRHLLGLIKIRFAVNDGKTTAASINRGLTNAFVTIFRLEKVLKDFIKVLN